MSQPSDGHLEIIIKTNVTETNSHKIKRTKNSKKRKQIVF